MTFDDDGRIASAFIPPRPKIDNPLAKALQWVADCYLIDCLLRSSELREKANRDPAVFMAHAYAWRTYGWAVRRP